MKLRLLFCFILFVAPHAFAQVSSATKAEFIYRVAFGRPEDVRLLLNQGADPDARNEKNSPALAIAAARTDSNALAIVQLLVEAGAGINQADPQGNYPLINAIRNANIPIAAYLLENGASVSVRTQTNKNIQEIADATKNRPMITLVGNAIKKEQARINELKSQNNMNRLLYEYAFHSCAYQYLSYYFTSKQDKSLNEQVAKRALVRQQQRVLQTANDLQQLFAITAEYLENISKRSAAGIYSVLESYISNRNRKAHGIGTDDDLITRCSIVAEPWKPKAPTTTPATIAVPAQ